MDAVVVKRGSPIVFAGGREVQRKFFLALVAVLLAGSESAASTIRPPGYPEPWTLVGESEPAPVLLPSCA
jgi:hypothetical protein